jgi:hypothetical protein
MHWPLQTWNHTFWHTDTSLSEKKGSGLLEYDIMSLGKGFCVFKEHMDLIFRHSQAYDPLIP